MLDHALGLTAFRTVSQMSYALSTTESWVSRKWAVANPHLAEQLEDTHQRSHDSGWRVDDPAGTVAAAVCVA